MADESIFEQFMKENQIKEATEKMGIKEEFQQEINKNISQGNRVGGFDNLNAKELLAIEDWVEEYVRKLSSNNTAIFDNPQKLENKNMIKGYITRAIKTYRDQYQQYMTPEHEEEVDSHVWDELVGYGPLEPLLADESVTEIMVIDAKKTYIEKKGELMLADIRFKDYDHIKRILDRIISPIGRKIDEQTPTVDARLPQGFRLNAVIAPIALNGGIFITIRKFPSKVWTPTDLINFGSAPKEIFDFLELCVKSKKNIIVSGGTSSGKTTLLNVLSNCIPPEERIITIEDSAELKLVGNHILSEESRHPNAEGKGAVTIRDLVKNALRQRPDRIVVGECRGGEALDMLQAMNTGHDGSLTTLHANSPRDAVSRLEYMCMIAGDMPLAAIKPQIASAVGLIVQIGRVRIKGKKCRRTLTITEVLSDFDENGEYQLVDIYDSKYKGNNKHDICATGYKPTFTEELVEDYGFDASTLTKPDHYEEPEPEPAYLKKKE